MHTHVMLSTLFVMYLTAARPGNASPIINLSSEIIHQTRQVLSTSNILPRQITHLAAGNGVIPAPQAGTKLTLPEVATGGLAKIQKAHTHYTILQLSAFPPARGAATSTDQSIDPTNWVHLSAMYDVEDLPQSLRRRNIELTLDTTGDTGSWRDQPRYELMTEFLDEPIQVGDIANFKDVLAKGLAAGLARFKTLYLANPQLRELRVLARPSAGLLSLSLPVDLYLEFVLLIQDPAMGQPNRVFYGVNSGDLFVDPNSDDSGLVRNTSPIAAAPVVESQFWKNIRRGLISYDEDHYLSTQLLEVGGKAHGAQVTNTNPLWFTDWNIGIFDPSSTTIPQVVSEDTGRTWQSPASFYGATGLVPDTPFKWADMKGKMDLVGAVTRLKKAKPGMENDLRAWRLFARPKQGELSEVLPGGMYFVFMTRDPMAPPGIWSVFVSVSSGDVYVDPQKGNSGLVRDKSTIPPLLPSSGTANVGRNGAAAASAGGVVDGIQSGSGDDGVQSHPIEKLNGQGGNEIFPDNEANSKEGEKSEEEI